MLQPSTEIKYAKINEQYLGNILEIVTRSECDDHTEGKIVRYFHESNMIGYTIKTCGGNTNHYVNKEIKYIVIAHVKQQRRERRNSAVTQ